MFFSYFDAVTFIQALSNISDQNRSSIAVAKKRLLNVKNFLKFLGNPEKKLKIIHIAGTSGKGSVAMMLQNILQSSGKKTGAYTSPHTTTYAERIRVGSQYIDEKGLVELVNFLKNKLDQYLNTSHVSRFTFQGLNFFEFSFVLSLLYFKKMHCEYAVIETGCGGRYDSTNAVKNPIFTIITNIGRDHLNLFGSMENLAREKAGIIKRGAPLLTGEQNKKWLKIFIHECKILNTEYVILNTKDIKNIDISLNGTNFKYKTEEYQLCLLGAHQARNAALAIECATNLGTPQKAIKAGLAKTTYPARLEVISKDPLIILDGAHNADKLKATIEFLEKITHYPLPITRYLIIAMAKNKHPGNLKELLEFFDIIYLTRFSNPFRKVMAYGDWRKVLPKNFKKKIIYKHDPMDALFDILPKLRNTNVVLITGSLFLAGELRKYWVPEKQIIKNRNSN